MGGDDAVGEVPRAAGVEQQAHLGLRPLERPLELLIGDQVLLLQHVGPGRGEVLQHPLHELPGGVPGGVHQHDVQLARLQAHDPAHGVDQQLLLKHHDDLLPQIVPGVVHQAVVYPLAELLPAVGGGDGLRLQPEHIEHLLDDDLFQLVKLLLREEAAPFAHLAAHNGLILGEGVADEPSGAHAQKVLHGVRAVARFLQLPLQGGEGAVPEDAVDLPVGLQPLVADGGHVVLLLGEMLHGVGFKVFDPLLAGPLALVVVVGQQPVDDLEQALVLLVDDLHADIILILPHHLVFHGTSSPLAVENLSPSGPTLPLL